MQSGICVGVLILPKKYELKAEINVYTRFNKDARVFKLGVSERSTLLAHKIKTISNLDHSRNYHNKTGVATSTQFFSISDG